MDIQKSPLSADSGRRRSIRSTSHARSWHFAETGARSSLPTLKQGVRLLELVAGGDPDDLNAVIGPRVGRRRRNCRAWHGDYNERRPHSAIGNISPIALVERSAHKNSCPFGVHSENLSYVYQNCCPRRRSVCFVAFSCGYFIRAVRIVV